jgi:hypothetical protein
VSGTIRVSGVVPITRPWVDGRPGASPEMLRQMIANFRPVTVPLLDRHRGMAVGFLTTLESDHDQDLVFSGEVVDYPDVVEALRAGASVSIEMAEGLIPTPGLVTRAAEFAADHPRWRQPTPIGWFLCGLALSTDPAVPGAVVWADPT